MSEFLTHLSIHLPPHIFVSCPTGKQQSKSGPRAKQPKPGSKQVKATGKQKVQQDRTESKKSELWGDVAFDTVGRPRLHHKFVV